MSTLKPKLVPVTSPLNIRWRSTALEKKERNSHRSLPPLDTSDVDPPVNLEPYVEDLNFWARKANITFPGPESEFKRILGVVQKFGLDETRDIVVHWVYDRNTSNGEQYRFLRSVGKVSNYIRTTLSIEEPAGFYCSDFVVDVYR